MPASSSGNFVMTKSVRQHKIVKDGKLQKSESSLICVVVAEGYTNVLPGSTNIFADAIDGLAGEEEELAKLVERLDKASTAYGMEISSEKTKFMTYNTSGINTEI